MEAIYEARGWGERAGEGKGGGERRTKREGNGNNQPEIKKQRDKTMKKS